MRRIIFFLLFCLSAGLWAQDAPIEQDAVNEPEAPPKVSYSVLHNEFYEASLKERSLGKLLYQDGNYDESMFHSSEAERLARLSDEYIARMMLASRVQRELAAADDRIAWAKQSKAATYYPKELAAAEAHREAALDSQREGDLDAALENALAVAVDLSDVAAPPSKTAPSPNLPSLPTQYKVRPWDKFGDCFWNISKWFYGSPWRWHGLYAANKHKIPDPNNPDLIEVGTVIDIPSVRGESRRGVYDTGHTFPQ
ncbi:MAG: hypothetical protein LBT01_01670 [Spirochaetaceae bacterium]|jgi:hypothetical protein|nr:hypothetical protein [Spirochaetaceae bacterium]